MNLHDKICQELADKGKILEGGWVAMRALILPDFPDMTVQVTEMRKAYFAGAQHLFASIMAVMDSDREPTANDMRIMDSIQKELDEFVKEMKKSMK